MSPTPIRQVLASDERKEHLYTHASRVFAARGFAGTKIADIAAAAQISQGLLYRYFDSKETLFTELIRGSFAKIDAAATALEEMPQPAHEKIVLALTRITANMESDPAFSERVLLIAQASISQGIPAQTKEVIRAESGKPYETVARIMASGQREGTIAAGSPMELATLFWTTIKGLALHKVAQGEDFKAPDMHIVARMFLRQPETQISTEKPA